MNKIHKLQLGSQTVEFHNQAGANIAEQDHSWHEPSKNMDIAALKNGAGNPHANWEADMKAKQGKDNFAIPYLVNLQELQTPSFNLQSLQQLETPTDVNVILLI